MSANATRQRKQPLGATDSDGVDHDKPASEPQGKALKKQSFNQFTGKLVLAAIALSSFYIWRLTLQSAEVGGWYNLATGHRPLQTPIAEQKASASVSSALGAQATGHHAAVEETVESQILKLAGSLGVKPRQLTEAIAPLLSPALLTQEDSAIHSSLTEEDELAAVAHDEHPEGHAHHHHGGVTGAVKGVVGGVGSLVDALAD